MEQWEPEEPTGGTISYIIGRDPSKWVRNAAGYRRLIRRNIYPGIDAVFYSAGEDLEYDVIVAPGADLARVRIRVSGAEKLHISDSGELIVETVDGEVRQHRPLLYQLAEHGRRRSVEGRFRLLARNLVGFIAGTHDPALPLSIDPVLASSAYIGGSDTLIAYDGTNSAGMTVPVDSPEAPVKGTHILVKLGFGNRTYVIGGSGTETVTCAVPIFSTSFEPLQNGGMWVGGYTDSPDLPTNSPVGQYAYTSPTQETIPWQGTYAGGRTDGFLLYLGTESFLTYVGTPGDDQVTALGVQVFSQVLVAGTTTGRGLPGPGSPATPFAPEPSGGLDGFLIVASPVHTNLAGSPNTITRVEATYYFGGAGDDRPLAIAVAPSGYYIAGETSSPDFPQIGSSRASLNGPSDGFILHLTGTYNLTLASSVLYGGGGADRITGVTVANSNAPPSLVTIAGTTSSLDLPVVNAQQTAFGGGSSDGFVARFSADLSQMVWSTYLGGSGDDGVLVLKSDSLGNVFVGGATSSPDFPVTANATQPVYGGGATDGFFVHYDIDGTLYHATYYGGYGADRVMGLYPLDDQSICLSGYTNSTDLPLKGTSPAPSGGSNGFIAHITNSVIGIAPIIDVKDVRVSAQAFLGNFDASTNTPLTITTSDPTTVQIAAAESDPGVSSISLLPNWQQPQFYVDCLTDSGGADLTLSAPGYPNRTTHVKCYPAILFPSPLSETVGLVSSSLSLGVSIAAPLPYGSAAYYYLTQAGTRPGVDPFVVNISNSNPAVAQVGPSITIGPAVSTGGYAFFTPLSPGTTDFALTSQIPLTSTDISITVRNPIDVASFSLPVGFQRQVNVSRAVTVTSSDPTKVLLSTSSLVAGQGSVTSPSYVFYAQALTSDGDVTLTISSPAFGTSTTVVHLTTPVLTGNLRNLNMSVGQSTPYVAYTVTAASDGSSGFFFVNPGTTMTVTLSNSDPTVVSAPSAYTFGPAGGAGTAVAIKALAPGSVTLTSSVSAGVALDPSLAQPVKIDVFPLPRL